MKRKTAASGRRMAAWFCLALATVTTGCGQGGPGRYDISGEVTFRGKPVPSGRILFAPDGVQANTGPGSVAEIHNGHYRTRRNLGAVGGPHLVTIYGTDGTPATEDRDNAMFPEYRTTVEMPAGSAMFDFAVPEQGDGKTY
ncbi:MAG: hypothetical protein U1E05_13960 [Patescibacteria group bacterium]|nr:hypothetical protein [Patescibacteria group bacterium]